MSETHSSIILIQIARSQRKLTGSSIHKAKAEVDKESLWNLIKTSCTRPLYFLLTEPIVQCFSIWCGFTWGVVYCLLEAITPMFQTIYGLNVQQTGYVYVTSSIGAMIGFFANVYQDKLYRRHFSHKQQEARLYLACVAALCLPIGMFIFAWTASPKIHWMVPIVGLSVSCVHERGHGHPPSDVPIPRRLLRYIRIFCPSWAEFIPELDGLGIPALHPTNVCHIDVQMGAYALCGPRPRDGSCAIRVVFLRIQDTCSQYRLPKDLGCRYASAALFFRVAAAITSKIGQGLSVETNPRVIFVACGCVYGHARLDWPRVYPGHDCAGLGRWT
jgi:hypothetical protein